MLVWLWMGDRSGRWGENHDGVDFRIGFDYFDNFDGFGDVGDAKC